MNFLKQRKASIGTIAAIAGTSLLLGACASNEVDNLAKSPVSGNAYNDSVARNYAEFAKYEQDRMYDTVDAAHFANKGAKALRGDPIEPEDPTKWSIENKEMMSDLLASRNRLMQALASDAAQKLPAATSRALVSYDCWVEQAEEGWQYRDIAGCREGFLKAMAFIDNRNKQAMLQQSAERQTVTPAEPARPSDYLVFFDWDSAVLSPAARSILQAAADSAKATDSKTFLLVGHADRSGPRTYNQDLSERRARAVADFLAGTGFDRQDIRTSGRGEADPLVETADGVREPQNRRVRITILDRRVGA